MSGTGQNPDDNSFAWRQFARLGEMMGDGLHHESDGKWIVKEYNKLARVLVPRVKEFDKEKRKQKAKNIDERMAVLILNKKCDCGGDLEQRRSGVRVCYCKSCGARYVAKYKKQLK